MAVFASRQIVLPQIVNYVNFIQSSGTQYFDTGFTPNSNTSIEISYYATEDMGVVIGSDKSWKSNGLTIGPHFLEFGSSSYNHSSADGNVHTVSVSGGVFTKDGLQIWSATDTFAGVCNLTILALNRSGVIQEYLTGKIYYCKIWDNGTLVRDFWPCYNPDGVACLYDKVEKKYYYNAGSGEFTAG